MKKPAKTPDEILKDAKSVKEKETLAPHEQTILTLREKKYSWREIAEFLRERGIDTDHSKVFRFIHKTGSTEMETLPETVPSAKEYRRALEQIKPQITDIQWKMLKFHYEVRNRTTTFTKIAQAADPDNSFRAANIHYGALGKLLGEKLDPKFPFERTDDDETKPEFYSSSIGTGKKYKGKDLIFIMHHELAKALDELGVDWFKKPSA